MKNNPRTLSDVERRDWLRLSRTENVGQITFRQLLRRFGSAQAALEALPSMAQRGGKRSFAIPPVSAVEDEIARSRKYGAKIIALNEPDYPEALAAIEDAPPLLTVLGDVSLLHKRILGIVGARNASLNGRKMAENLARNLGEQSIVIASGMARGIDTAAHQGSLPTGSIAVLAGGIDVVYPEENRALYDKLAEQGCIISDQPLGCEPYAKLFPRRNRLISGLSLGVIVVEAARQSGSLITARMALEQGREVFAVPGSPLDPRCAGTNDLIRQGAVLTEGASDILGHIHALPAGLSETSKPELETPESSINEDDLFHARDIVLESLGPSPVSIDELIRECVLPASTVMMVLLELELAGRIERQPGQKIVLIGAASEEDLFETGVRSALG
ncbi:MAG: DNA-processing protein DprA [Alphaproteobacteria bacterium]|nr:DNA-processing protein DprA [Alphaproteobacteria bacterium]